MANIPVRDRSTILVLNGPNLNVLGLRQPEIYGRDSLADVRKLVPETATPTGFPTDCRQSNHEGRLIDWIQEARERHAAIIINPAGYSHTSVALRDALATCDGMPILEVHISNIHQREAFRHHSYVSALASGVIAGCGDRKSV